MRLRHILMIATALCGSISLAAVPALADNTPQIHVLTLRKGVVVKSVTLNRMPNASGTNSISASTSISTSANYRVKTVLRNTLFTLQSASSICYPDNPLKVGARAYPAKTKYAKVSAGSVTYSIGCRSGPVTAYGDSYDLRTRHAVGKTDHFDATFKFKFKLSMLTVHEHVTVSIGP